MYKDIMVHIDSSSSAASRLDLAITVARKFDARLTGLYVITRSHYSPRCESAFNDAEQAQMNFCRIAADNSLRAEWRLIESPVVGANVSDVLVRATMLKDLLIVGQELPGSSANALSAVIPETLLRGVACPVMVVPYAGSFCSAGKRVLVAWRGGRESSRAVHDALPFLLQAELVTVLEVVRADSGEHPEQYSCASLCEHLACYGIDARHSRLIAATDSVGDVLLNQAWEVGCDLLVMGAFGSSLHGSARIGAVAGNVLDHLTVPVLMGH